MADHSESPDSAVLGTTIRLFVSSTFADFQIERDVLQHRVFPELRRLCAASSFRLQPIDLRWGVPEVAGTDRQTLRICFDELERCRQLSPDCFLLILLGERYGSYILPPQVPAALVARLTPHLAPEERTDFDAAYRLDENAVPSEYVLLHAEGPNDAADEVLRLALVRAGQAAGATETDRLPFEGSATHREIQQGLLGTPPGVGVEAGVLCAVRTFAGERVGPAAARFSAQDSERTATVRRLTETVLARLPADQVRRYSVAWDGERGPAFDEDALAAAYTSLLRPKLEAVIAARIAARESAAIRGRDAATLANATFEAERVAHFVGREGPLAAIAAYLGVPAAVPLVVAGPGGVGKSTLLVKAVERAAAAHPGALLLARYVGVTPGAGSLRTLLDGLRAELAVAYGRQAEPVREESERSRAFREALGWATAERPLLLVVDALDQLGPAPVPLDWLPETLPPHVHLIASLLDEDDRPEVAALLAREPAPSLVPLGRMDAAEGDALLGEWLDEAGRTLRPAQRDVVLAAFAAEGRPLYLRLAFEEARLWRSFDDPADRPPLDPTIPGILAARFARLERPDEHGPVLTGHTLGLLRAARNGLAEDELLALLARDDAVRDEQRALAPLAPPIEPTLPLPAALWARLYADLAAYLTEREADGARLFTFYHRQLAEVAAARYLRPPDGAARHAALARYFAAQPLLEGGAPNLRKLSEQPAQEAAAGLTEALHRTLTDLGFLERKIAYQRTAGALDDLALAPPDDALVRDVAAALRLGAHILDGAPDQVENQVRGRAPVEVRAAVHDLPQRPGLRLDSRSLTPVGGPLVRTFAGHADKLTAGAFSPDGRLVLSASEDHTLRLWDVASGHALHTLEGHTREVVAAAFSPDGRLVLSGSWDGTLRLWDVASGQALHVLDGHTDAVTACAFSPDGHLILSASAGHPDYVMRTWDVASGQPVRMLTGHHAQVRACMFSPDGRLALSASYDGTLRLWDVASGQALRTFEWRGGWVFACAFSPDGQLALAASEDRTLRLWDVASGQPLHVLEGHTERVFACAFSPDGRTVLSASRDRTLRTWDVASGQTLRVLKGHTDPVLACAFSPDGRTALSASGDLLSPASDRTLRLWDVASGQCRCEFTGHTGPVRACAFSPDGRLALSASDDKTLRLWDATSVQALHTLDRRAARVADCVFSPDGRLALSARDDGNLYLWDVTSGQLVHKLEGHTEPVLACAFSPDARLALTASRDRTLRLWDVTSGRPMHVLDGHTSAVTACAFSPDGHLALSGSWDHTLRLWDVTSGRSLRVLRGHFSAVVACAFSPDGLLVLSASGAEDHTLRLWDVASGRKQHTLEGHTMRVLACAFSPDGRLALSASWDHTLRLWDVASGEAVHVLEGHTGDAQACAFSPDGRTVLSASRDRTLRTWEVTSGRMLHTLKGHTGPVERCAFSPDGRQALSASRDRTLRTWDVTSGRMLHTLKGHTGPVERCAFSPDGRLALSASDDGTLRTWDVASGQSLRTLQEHADDQMPEEPRDHTLPVTACAISPDGRLALSASDYGTIRLWDMNSEQVVHVLDEHERLVNACTFSPDGRLVLSASRDETLRLWDVASGETVHVLEGHTGGVLACAFSPDGRLALSTSDDKTLRLWDVASGETVHVLEGHTGGVLACAFSPDGRLILSASQDKTVRLWDVASGQSLRVLEGHTGRVDACAFSPDGRLVLSAGRIGDQTLRLWDVASGQCLHVLEGHSDSVNACTFSPDGRLALSASDDKTLRLWDVSSRRSLHVLHGHTGKVVAGVFSPDGRLVLSASDDGSLRLWDVTSGDQVGRSDADAPLECCAVSPLGGRVVAGDASGTMHFLTVDGVESAFAAAGTTRPEPSAAARPATQPEMGTAEAQAAALGRDGGREPQPGEATATAGVRWWWPFGRRG